jgi:hypothetical protein
VPARPGIAETAAADYLSGGRIRSAAVQLPDNNSSGVILEKDVRTGVTAEVTDAPLRASWVPTALMMSPTFCQPKGIITPPLGNLRLDIVSAEQHRAIRIEQSSVHLLGGS